MRQNLATLLTRDQIVAALDQIVANNINLRPSTKFDLEYNGRTFPPKEVIREAARLAGMDPDRFWLNGGPPTNDALVKLGFTVAPKAFTNQSGPRELIDALKAFMDKHSGRNIVWLLSLYRKKYGPGIRHSWWQPRSAGKSGLYLFQ